MKKSLHPLTTIRLTLFLIGFCISPAMAQFTPTLYRAINLNGAALTIDGNSWQSSAGASNFSYTQTGGGTFENQSVALVPSTDANRATMIRSSIWGNSVNVNVTSVPGGSYDVYLYVWEDNEAQNYSVSLEGAIVVPDHNSGSAGTWNKLGPFRTNITDGAINVSANGGHACLSGIEIWTAPNPPVVSNAMVDQLAMVGESFNFTFPFNTFTDPDAGTTLTYSASLFNGSALPSWLTFNATTRTFSGTPASGDAAALNIRVTASDGDGGSANDVFLLTVNTGIYNLYRAINLNGSALTIDGNSWEASSGASNFSVGNNGTITDQSIPLNPATDANRSSMIRSAVWGSLNLAVSSVPAGNYAIWVYVWEDSGPVTYSFSIEGTAAVSNYNSGSAGTWAKLGPFLRTIDDGAINLSVTGIEAILSGVEIYSVNIPPVVSIAIADQVSVVDEPFDFTVPSNTFSDPDAGTTLTYSATLSSGSPLPSWLTFNATTRNFSGTPVIASVGNLEIRVTASDGEGGIVYDDFTLTVDPPPFTPALYRAINLNGDALTIDGNSWEASAGAANFSYTQTEGGVFANQGVTLVPSTDANRATMIRSSIWGASVNVNVTSVPNESYDVYLYVWEDNAPETYAVSLEGIIVVPSHNSGSAGAWNRLGPFRINLADGAINISVNGGHANVSGIEIWTAPNPPVVSNAMADQLAIVGESFNFTIPSNTFTDPDPGTTLTYSVTLSSGSALPSWLTFNAGTRTFTGTPASGDAAGLNIRVTAADGDGGTADDIFILTVNTGVYTLYRAINLNGSALTIDGNSWEASSGASNFSVGGNGTITDQSILLNPPTDANRSSMIRSAVWGSLNLAVSSVPAGDYAIWVYVWEDSGPVTYSFSIEGTAAVSDYNSGSMGTWAKLGPFLRTVNDGAINLSVTGIEAILSGIEIYTVDGSAIPVTGVSVSPAALSLAPGQTGQLSGTIAPANATNQNVTWSSDNTVVATVDNTGLVSAVSEGTATITATTVSGGFIASTTVTVSAPTTLTSVLEQFAFQYKYDGRRRMTHKKVPGADWVYMVYDNRDRLVMTQDGEQRKSKKWTFTKYDELNRPVLTGIFTDPETTPHDQDDMQLAIDNFYIAADEVNNPDDWFEARGEAVHGYTNQSFPNVNTESDYLTVTYYDDYLFRPLIGDAAADFDYDADQLTASGSEPGQRAEEFTRVQGQVTGSKIKNLDTNEFLWSINYYDDRYRVIQVIAQNNKEGLDKISNVYDFVGKVLRTKTDHTTAESTIEAIATTRKFTYDHAGRVLQTTHQTVIPGSPQDPVILTSNEYNELGQLVTKNVHSEDEINYKQQVDYRYNIRGWLTRINDSNLSAADGGPKDYFGMELGYNDPLGISAAQQYNGNISAIKWSTNLGLGFNDTELEIFEPTSRGYGFTYDPMNRMKTSAHFENTVGWNAATSFHENIDEYDLNGNIKKLKRTGKDGNNMDLLDYTYSGNRLMKVIDDGNDTEGFKDGNVTGDDYLYDDNGNMIIDKNKDIASIEYNYLNLPAKVTKTDGQYVKYVYNAAGVKMSQEVYDASDVLKKKTDYLGEFFYENDTLKFVNHEEGRIVMTGSEPEYQYILKDHLGNTRITFTAKHEVETFTAKMDTENQEEEQEIFGAYNSYTDEPLDPTPAENSGDQILILNGSTLAGDKNGQVGLTKSFAVVPGDKVTATVRTKYFEGSSPGSALLNFASVLINAFALTPPLPGEGRTAFEALDNFGSVIAAGERPEDDDNSPKGFLTIIVFDKDYQLVDYSFEQTLLASDTLIASVEIRQAGYAYVFLSNEGATVQQIGFDNYIVMHEHSAVIQQDDYYPFGLTFNSYQRENSLSQDYKYNGKELQDELNLGWYDYMARQYDPETGRFLSIDPLAELSRRWSPYTFAFNNPIRFTDPDGMLPEDNVEKTRKLEVTSSKSSDQIKETNTTSTTARRTVKEGSKEFTELLGKSTMKGNPSNGIGNEITVVETTTTSTETVTNIEYDENGSETSRITSESTTIATATSVVVKDQHGGAGGGFSERNTSSVTSNNPTPSEAMTRLTSNAVNYRATNGVSITNRDEFAGRVALQRNASQTWDKYNPTAGVLSGARYGSAGSLALGLASTAVSFSLERGLKGLEHRSKNDPCNNCTKSYPVNQR